MKINGLAADFSIRLRIVRAAIVFIPQYGVRVTLLESPCFLALNRCIPPRYGDGFGLTDEGLLRLSSNRSDNENVIIGLFGMYGTMVMTDSGMGDAIRAALHAMLEESSDPDALLARLEREGELWADKLAQGAEAEEVMTLLAEAIANTRRATLDRGRH
ncbi:MAG: hypothetical protein NTW56_11680 [Alphaproteobacteria bacterium]|nr:hypothetical protein [Alphaproteobacteria bacterium]